MTGPTSRTAARPDRSGDGRTARRRSGRRRRRGLLLDGLRAVDGVTLHGCPARRTPTAFFTVRPDETTGNRTGLLVEYDLTSNIFSNPSDKRTEDYISGRFG